MNGKKVLIIDDDPNISDVYSVKFTQDGFDVAIAADAKDALAKIEAGLTPDAILLDIIMPGTNGIELLGQLVTNPKLAATKIFIFSNLDQRSEIDSELLKKIAGYYLKVDMIPSEMEKKVREALGMAVV